MIFDNNIFAPYHLKLIKLLNRKIYQYYTVNYILKAENKRLKELNNLKL